MNSRKKSLQILIDFIQIKLIEVYRRTVICIDLYSPEFDSLYSGKIKRCEQAEQCSVAALCA